MSAPRSGIVAAGLCLISATAAFAHGPQIQIGIGDNKIITRGLFPDGPYHSATAPQLAYVIPMSQRSLGDASDGWYTQPTADFAFTGPGLALLNGQFAIGSNLKVSYTDGLKFWNGSAFVDPGTEQVAASRNAAFTTSILTTDAGPFGSIPLNPVAGSDDEHGTIRWRLLGNGTAPNSPSDDGVYLLSLQVSSDQPGIVASDRYYFVLAKNASAGELSSALAYVNSTLVPEPATLGLIAPAMLLARRRRP